MASVRMELGIRVATMSESTYKGQNLHFQCPFAFLDNQVNPNLSGPNPVEEYMRCALVMFASVRRFHPRAKLTLVTNMPLSKSWLLKFASIDCENRVIPFEFKSPDGYMDSFQGSLFLLDLLSNLENSEVNVVLDPDIVCVSSLPEGFSREIANQIGVLDLAFDKDHTINGLSPRDQRDYQARNHHPSPHFSHFGGELYVIPASRSTWLKQEILEAWDQNMENFKSGQSYLVTEEHILNYVLGKTKTTDLSNIANRIWTAVKYRLIPEDIDSLAFWHLPSEKGFGFTKLYNLMSKPNSWFNLATNERFKRLAARTMSVSGWPPMLKACRVAKKLQSKFC